MVNLLPSVRKSVAMVRDSRTIAMMVIYTMVMAAHQTVKLKKDSPAKVAQQLEQAPARDGALDAQ